MATVYRPRITRWLLGKKRVNSKTPGAIKKRSTSKIWWYRYTDANGVQQQERGCKDRSATMALAVAAERAAEKNEAPPMTVGQAIVAFQASRSGRDEKYVADVVRRIEDASRFNRWVHVSDVDATELLKWAARHEEHRSVQADLRAVKMMTKHLSETVPNFVDPLKGVRVGQQAKPKRIRRALSDTEFCRLLEATAMSKIVWRGLTGSRRRDLYLFASVSGFRREEIAALDVTAFAADKSSVRYKAEDDKSRRGGTQPLPPGKMGTVTLPTSGKAWPGTWSERSADMVKIDLKATGIQYETEEGFFDFHTLRVQFITTLARRGVSLAMAQKLARHSDPKLTSAIYSRFGTGEERTAVGVLE